MATIRKRGSRYNVQIRKEGYPSITKTFASISVAKKWAKGVEADMERRIHVEVPDQTTVGELLKRYQKQISPAHKGQQVEAYRLGTLKKHLGSLRLIHLTPKEVASYRDLRLKEVSSASLKRELTILSRILTVASRDWGISIPQNPVGMISLPKADKARTRRLEVGEEEKLLRSSNQKLRRIIVLALETAMRRGEILNIKKSHIDLQKSVLLIPSTKTDTPRTITTFNRCCKCSQRRIEGFSKRIWGGNSTA